jgi:stage V sporulation protein G
MTTAAVEVVDIRKIIGDGNLKAYADVKIAGHVIVKGFSVMQGKRGIFVSMPRRAGKDGRWFDILTPTNEDFKQELEEKVLEAYDREVDGVAG